MPSSASPLSNQPSRVIWTDPEKAKIVKRAVIEQRERPELSGLALLRVAMEVLPPDRRRRLVSRSQVAWFVDSLAEETKKLTAELKASATPVKTALVNHPDDPYVPILSETRDITKKNHDRTETLATAQAKWRDEALAFYAGSDQHHETNNAILALIYNELRAIREHAGIKLDLPNVLPLSPGINGQPKKGRG